RYDLLKRIKRVKGTHRHPNFRSGRGMWRADLNTTGIKSEGMIWRDEERRRARGLERARGVWRQFIMRLCIDIIKVAVNLKQVVVIFGCVFIQRVAIPQGQLNATVIFIELEVDHAGNRVRPVGGGSAIFQNLDALDSRNGNAIQIDESAAGIGPPRKRGDTAAIDQKQRSARVETT